MAHEFVSVPTPTPLYDFSYRFRDEYYNRIDADRQRIEDTRYNYRKDDEDHRLHKLEEEKRLRKNQEFATELKEHKIYELDRSRRYIAAWNYWYAKGLNIDMYI